MKKVLAKFNYIYDVEDNLDRQHRHGDGTNPEHIVVWSLQTITNRSYSVWDLRFYHNVFVEQSSEFHVWLNNLDKEFGWPLGADSRVSIPSIAYEY